MRDAHRAFQRLLERRIAPHGVTRGQWYFLRVLWTEDGLSQRELSARVGMMEPTTVIALRSMEKAGLIRRVRSTDDRRVTHVWLTAKAKRMRDGLLQLARGINAQADEGHFARGHRGVPPRHRADDGKPRQGRADERPSLHLDAGGLDHLGDALDLAVEELAEFGSAAAHAARRRPSRAA